MENTAKNIESNAQSMEKKLSAGAHQAVDKMAQAAAPAAEWLEDQSQNLKEFQEKSLDVTTKYLRQHPFASLGMAVASGFLLHKLINL